MISVKSLWTIFPKGFKKYDEFYKALGNDIPLYYDLDGGIGIEKLFCISKYLNVEKICKDFDVLDYTTTDFITEENKFNNNHYIHEHYATLLTKTQP